MDLGINYSPHWIDDPVSTYSEELFQFQMGEEYERQDDFIVEGPAIFYPWQRFLLAAVLATGLIVAAGLWLLTKDVSTLLMDNQGLFASYAIEDQSSNSSNLALLIEGDLEKGQPASDFNNCKLSNQFPARIQQWCIEITTYASKRGLPPDLVAAVILQESGGDPYALSSSGAVGLMQVMPRDGLAASFLCANGPCFAQRPSTEQLKEPEFNIAYGTKMLASLLDRYGDMREALRYYGPMDAGYTYADKVLGIYQQLGN